MTTEEIMMDTENTEEDTGVSVTSVRITFIITTLIMIVLLIVFMKPIGKWMEALSIRTGNQGIVTDLFEENGNYFAKVQDVQTDFSKKFNFEGDGTRIEIIKISEGKYNKLSLNDRVGYQSHAAISGANIFYVLDENSEILIDLRGH